MLDAQSAYIRFDRLREVDSLLSGLRRNEATAVEQAICFLEEDPWFLFSGYSKEYIIAALKHVQFSRSQVGRLAFLIIRSVDEVKRREFKQYSRLAGVLRSAEIRQAMETRLSSSNPTTARRAKQVLEVIKNRERAG